MEHAKVVVKQSGEKLDKKKSQFNYESVIEITLPSAPAPPCQILDASREKSHAEEKFEEPIKPVICTSLKPKIPSQSKLNMSPSSLHESLVSNKQNPMEWDSFIPVSCFTPSPLLSTVSLKCIFTIFRATSRRHSKTFNYAIRWSSAIAN